ncbi:hypothetical protein CRYUN_Cryun09bG0164300 [Craigia yunnanensis]
MRMEAAHAEVFNHIEISVIPSCLSNPLTFFDNKKRGKDDNQTLLESFTSSTTSGWPMTRPLPSHPGHSDVWNGSQATANYCNSFDESSRGMFGTPPTYPETSPKVWNPSNALRYGNFPCPSFSPAGNPNFNHRRDRPQMFGNNPVLDSRLGGSPGFNSERGKGHGYSGSISLGMGRSGRRGQGFHGRSSASNRTLRAECFFDESMLKDSWLHLKPIL